MVSADQLVARMRAESGLSQRALAERAGCTRSTIVRIEAGEMDPTVTMLARIAVAAGRTLNIEVNEGRPKAPSLAAIAATTHGIDDLNWTRLRSTIDAISQHPGNASIAIMDPPPRTRDLVVDNLIAGIAEKIADDAHLPRPHWTKSQRPLLSPWLPPGTPKMQSAEAAGAPPQLAARNVMLSAANLWRTTTP